MKFYGHALLLAGFLAVGALNAMDSQWMRQYENAFHYNMIGKVEEAIQGGSLVKVKRLLSTSFVKDWINKPWPTAPKDSSLFGAATSLIKLVKDWFYKPLPTLKGDEFLLSYALACAIEKNQDPALLMRRREIVATLIDHGADINCYYGRRYSRTPLHTACSRKLLWLTGLLFKKDAQVDVRDSLGKTPFMKIAQKYQAESFDVASRLVTHGASIIEPCGDKRRASIDEIYMCNKKDARRLVFEAFRWALENNDTERLQELSNHHSPAMQEGFNSQDDNGNTLLHLIAGQPKAVRIEIVKSLFLKNGAHQLETENGANLTPLHVAVDAKNEKVFGWLIMRGADMTKPYPKPRQNENLVRAVVCSKNENMRTVLCSAYNVCVMRRKL